MRISSSFLHVFALLFRTISAHMDSAFQSTSQFILFSNLICLASILFGFSSIFIILRYTTKSMMSYRLHLLNMAITIMLCDVCVAFVLRPHGLFPGTGLCMIGAVNGWLTENFGPEFSFYLTAVGFF